MAALSTVAFLAKWASLFADNGSRDISEEDVRDFRQDVADSFLNSVDRNVANALVDCGNYDASTNLWPDTGTAIGSASDTTIKRGDFFYISVAGTLGGNFVDVGTEIRAKVNEPGQTASNWRIIL